VTWLRLLLSASYWVFLNPGNMGADRRANHGATETGFALAQGAHR